MDLGEWMVYLFCDDTAFVAENPAMMDILLNCYKTFTVRWRIRVNPGKCKVCTVSQLQSPKPTTLDIA